VPEEPATNEAKVSVSKRSPQHGRTVHFDANWQWAERAESGGPSS